ncbi:LacI family DNA-binding transcriptional regulator [Sphingobacterium bovistauri]|uniref:LacI family DNA-binding transcriptional regulator n=1 Tax=Sphingobacterium bovistauri TaxID=2781959 RepID=A0ABS7Z923_9SPHI|nr:LacI family DNA-binding transcriptional regulator [Sphingobacterium bovistauri]MCA5005454.1 LacI family DNA-binding transcriptional regulator [Sphingobacterium bovistauri]
MSDHEEKKKFGIKDIARIANVSIATVDRVLNNRKDVSDSTREKIKQIIKENNYQPNLYARSLSVKNNLSFAVLIPRTSLETGYWQLCLDGINKGISEFSSFGIVIEVFLFDQEQEDTFLDATEKILSKKFNAVIIAPIFIEETKIFVQECRSRNIHTIFINSDIPGYSSMGYIGPDLYSTGKLAGNLTSYLVKDSSKVLILNVAKGLENYKYLNTKIDGYKNYLNAMGKSYLMKVKDIPFNNYDEIEPELLRLNFEIEPDIVFVTNSRVSVVAKFFYEHQELNKPYIIGFDFLSANVDYLSKGYVDFLICQRPDKQGYMALNHLYRYFLLKEGSIEFKSMPIDILTKENYAFYEN